VLKAIRLLIVDVGGFDKTTKLFIALENLRRRFKELKLCLLIKAKTLTQSVHNDRELFEQCEYSKKFYQKQEKKRRKPKEGMKSSVM
jgi:hypothetical protein